MPSDPSARSRLLTIPLVAAGVLIFEVTVTRILSVTLAAGAYALAGWVLSAASAKP